MEASRPAMKRLGRHDRKDHMGEKRPQEVFRTQNATRQQRPRTRRHVHLSSPYESQTRTLVFQAALFHALLHFPASCNLSRPPECAMWSALAELVHVTSSRCSSRVGHRAFLITATGVGTLRTSGSTRIAAGSSAADLRGRQ